MPTIYPHPSMIVPALLRARDYVRQLTSTAAFTVTDAAETELLIESFAISDGQRAFSLIDRQPGTYAANTYGRSGGTYASL